MLLLFFLIRQIRDVMWPLPGSGFRDHKPLITCRFLLFKQNKGFIEIYCMLTSSYCSTSTFSLLFVSWQRVNYSLNYQGSCPPAVSMWKQNIWRIWHIKEKTNNLLKGPFYIIFEKKIEIKEVFSVVMFGMETEKYFWSL